MITGRLMKNPLDNKITFDMYLGNKSKEPMMISLATSLQIIRFDGKVLNVRVFNDKVVSNDESIEVKGERYNPIPNVIMVATIDRLYIQEDLMENVKMDASLANNPELTKKVFTFKGMEITEEKE